MQKVAYFKDGNENVVYEIMDKKARDDIAALPKDIIDKLTSPFTSTGSIIQCHPVEGYPLDVSVSLEPIQEGSGDPSPDNIRPISGHTGAKLVRCGKNLLEKTMVSGTQSGITFTINTDGSITVNGTATGDCYRTVCTDVGLPAGDYILSGCPTSGGSGKYILYFAPSASPNVADVGNGANITVREGQTHAVTIKINKGVTVDNITFYPMIRKASEMDGTYEPYHGDTYPVEFGQTVYGGTVDLDAGELAAEWAMAEFNGTEAWTAQANANGGKRYRLIDIIKAVRSAAICSHVPYFGMSAYWGTETGLYNGDDNGFAADFVISSELAGSLDEWKSYLAAQKAAGTPVQIAYKLATPNTIATTAHDIPALDGTNTVYADAGDVTVNGRIDPEYLNNNLLERIAALEAAAVN